ncbi:dTMP kinase [Kitasatospora sp. NPDC053057]|uniref:dTMP kinase n=1 Tax=Kitasatospora sp. NPDC053057 TaxID=3364062 RepID=UPI0037C5F523
MTSVGAPFFVLEGPDGAGKTTLARAVAADLAASGLVHLDRRQVSTDSAYAALLMEPLARMLWHSGDARDLSDNFWAHLQASWFTAHGEQVVAPALKRGPVVVDGWFYKLASKLTGQGWGAEELAALFNRVRTPDHVVLLDVAPELLWERKATKLRPAELGMHGQYDELGRASFLAYQQAGLDQLRARARTEGWHVLAVDADETVQETGGRLTRLITDLLDRSAAPNANSRKETPL